MIEKKNTFRISEPHMHPHISHVFIYEILPFPSVNREYLEVVLEVWSSALGKSQWRESTLHFWHRSLAEAKTMSNFGLEKVLIKFLACVISLVNSMTYLARTAKKKTNNNISPRIVKQC